MVNPLVCYGKTLNREPKPKPPFNETPTQKKQSPAQASKKLRNRPLNKKILQGRSTHHSRKPVSRHTRVIHVFDVGDITEVLLKFAILQHTGVIVRAAHNRSLDSERSVFGPVSKPISFEQEIELPQTQQRPAKLSCTILSGKFLIVLTTVIL